MATNFPTSLDTYTTKVDNTDDVMAVDVNSLQDAIEAIETKVGIDSSAVSTTIDYNMIPSGTKMWFYQNTAPQGWTIDSTPADALLAVKGGSQAYNTTGGTQAGTWTQTSHTHSHSHVWYTVDTAVGKDGAGTPISNSTSHNSGIMAHNTLGTTSINNTNLYTGTDATSGAPAATWRPLAQIGIICTKD